MSNTKKSESLALEIRKSRLENLQKVNGSFNIHILSGADTNNERPRHFHFRSVGKKKVLPMILVVIMEDTRCIAEEEVSN